MFKPDIFKPYTDDFYETANQVHGWVMHKARDHFAIEARRKMSLRNVVDFEAFRDEKKRRFLDAIGGLPEQRHPLNTRCTRRIPRDGYEIRNVIFTTLPGFYVTGNLYVPAELDGPAPGVLMVCGHAVDGKAAPKYQQVCLRLVRAGFVVLIIDSPSHGELIQCLDDETGNPLAGWNTAEHSYLQKTALLSGQNIMRYFAWNAMQALDLLSGLPEVDPTRLGVTGNSGGGHLTQALLMLEPRISAAMSCCSLTSRENYLACGIRAFDGEQNYFASISGGLDYDDFLASFAPKPLRLGVAGHDFFPIEGALEVIERARSIYRLYGAEDRISLCLAADQPHGYTTPLAQGCVEWFSTHLMGRRQISPTDDPAVEDAQTLRCTQSGQVMKDCADARSILELNRDAWQAARRAAPEATRERLRRDLGLAEPILAPRFVRCTSRSESDRHLSERLFYFSEPDILVTAVLYRPLGPVRGATLMLLPNGTRDQDAYRQDITDRLHKACMVMVFDMRGLGAVEMRRRNTGDGFAFRSTEFRVANDHFTLGTSMVARRTFDALGALALLRGREELSAGAEVELFARGRASLYGLFAAAVDGRVACCDLDLPATSWDDSFAKALHNCDFLSEPLLAPELRGGFDIEDLRRLAGMASQTS